ncbi:rRNA maturation RNase YbeY [candidate division WWE3 bacterium]|uniref:Endoribonuclease YbeY n=1 Tax=candidate division WWE3 bacterium TaxID=2053526 RepID=A0A955LFY1_UNCKA|nr:rRNA maturation RNase YbeY [candidate division WWE3 bacterium]
MAKIQVDFSIVDDQFMIRLNSQWFNKENPTDVISFPMSQNDSDTAPEETTLLPKLAGEIVVDEDEIRRNAEKFGVSFEQELARVVAHGVLHLYGYEDDTDERRQAMKSIEDTVVNDFR